MNESIKVLLVDDEDQFRATTKRILDKRGFETLAAATGEQALTMIKEKPDVVILDIKMPGISGHEVLKEIKKISPETPVIMLTGHGALPSAEKAKDQGAFDYLSKPCSMDLLASRITDAYRQSGHDIGNGDSEKLVRDVMIPISAYSTLAENATLKDAVATLKQSYLGRDNTSSLTESGHNSLLVLSSSGKMLGVLAIEDIFNAVVPAYLSAPKPSTADSIQYSPMFWRGILCAQLAQNANTRLKDIMSPAPLTIDADANLMEAVYSMLQNETGRLAVTDQGEVLGIIRKQDILFEMGRILKE
ncbi:CBS domain-containing protein [Desulfatibacillum alkenivorans DSM 16219]|jgi:DNA-binding response OmpR family regulator|uniref:CBS domain-containing protein n=1 Tax=Desulfatibacillum alkenivorans DSM 16219 TaxID=1121393 RepID=A0A1M6XKN2_9BACT|nr:response regulator [Desulfatibacillum alkenivorans]SHL06560.1 CBS domain-containing protein [Desulfatibacillum alkenivorans DSM 16219]